MKIQNSFLPCLFLALVMYCHRKDTASDTSHTLPAHEYTLVLERGAFHYDSFELTPNKVKFVPETGAAHEKTKYNDSSETILDPGVTLAFFEEVENRGFWILGNHYKTESSCSSLLKVTLKKEGKIKSVSCDDFERDCPELMKYIEKKVIELEGNGLERIDIPG